MKIVHVLTRLLRAGSEENTLLTCKGQVQRGHSVYLVHGHEFDQAYYRDLDPAIQLIEAPSLTRALRPLEDLKALRELVGIFTRIKPDVVHTHQSKAGILGRSAAALTRVPTVVHGVHIVPFHNVGAIQKYTFLAAEKIAAKATHGFVCVSAGMKNAYRAHAIGRDTEHFVVHSGFDLDRFRAPQWPDDWRALLGVHACEEKPPTVAMLAALEPRKRHLEFLEHVPRIITAVPGLKIVLAGEGHLKEEIRARIAEMGLEGSVKLTGFRTDPERIIALADICILTSFREGLPRAIVQYLAAGKPVVACNLPGLSEIATNGENAIVVDQDDLAGVADAVADLAGTAHKRERLSAAARRSELGSWDATVMTEQIERVYDVLLERRASA